MNQVVDWTLGLSGLVCDVRGRPGLGVRVICRNLRKFTHTLATVFTGNH